MKLFDQFRQNIPSPTDIIEQAISNKIIPPLENVEYLKRNFSNLVEELQIDAYEIYLKAEEKEGKRVINKVLKERVSENSSVTDVIEESAKMFKELDKFFLSLTQSRRPRAGKAFEIILKTLFKKIKYPFDEQQVINGKPDFLMPNKNYYERNAMDCIIFTAKRTLRERWRQIVTEGTQGLGFFLATIDDAITKPQLEEMKKNRIYLVVPVRIKSNNSKYLESDNVITFEEFFEHHLDPAVKRWKSKNVINTR